MTEWCLALPFQLPSQVPNMNSREHWAPKSRKVKEWRDATHVLARAAKIPPCQRVRVELHYTPAVKRGRDQDNLMAAMKPACDGLVDAKVVPNDTPEYMERVMPVIYPAQKILPKGSSRFVLKVVRVA